MSGKLTALSVRRIKKPGMYHDGGGLYLQVTGSGAKSWIYRFMLHGKAREMGLGPLSVVSLAQARNKAVECRRLRHEGVDPLEARKAERAKAALGVAKTMTFDECAAAYIAAHRTGWRSVRHLNQWKSTFAAYVTPVFGKLPVQTIDTALVMKVLEPIWNTKAETASRVRRRIEAVLDWAKAREFRDGENPARWRGHLKNLLPAPSKVRKVEHHPALPYTEIGDLMATLRERDSVAARALEFIILSAARSGEVRGARWTEIDLSTKLWAIPPSRMNTGREHRVPLSDAAIAALKRVARVRENDRVFPGDRQAALGERTLKRLLQAVGRGGVTVHGFRSTFRDWVAEQTTFPGEVAEMALAHAVSDKTEAAYRRGDMFEKRRQLMNAWAEYCGAVA
jgi:integrase